MIIEINYWKTVRLVGSSYTETNCGLRTKSYIELRHLTACRSFWCDVHVLTAVLLHIGVFWYVTLSLRL
jgi:hypothetical protein